MMTIFMFSVLTSGDGLQDWIHFGVLLKIRMMTSLKEKTKKH